MTQQNHPEDALYEAGARSGYYEIVGASYTPATESQPAAATIDLSTVDQTGCLLTHNYGTAETVLKWDTEMPGEVLMGTSDDVLEAIHGITGGSMGPVDLFTGFQFKMTAGPSDDKREAVIPE